MSVMYEVSSVGGNRLDAAAAIRNATRVRPQDTVKSHMLRFLRRSKSMAHRSNSNTIANPNTLATTNHTVKNSGHLTNMNNGGQMRESPHIRGSDKQVKSVQMRDNREVKRRESDRQSVPRNGVVVTIVDGLPLVVGNKNKTKVCRI